METYWSGAAPIRMPRRKRAITYIADKWDIMDALETRLHDLAETYREGAEAARRSQSANPYAGDGEAKQKAWAAGAAGSPH